MAHQVLTLTSVHEPTGYSHASRVGNTLYIAGQVAKDRDNNLVGRSDIEAQVRQVYANLASILEETGGRLENIVKMTTFLTDLASIGSYRKVRNELFAEPYPPNTLVIVQSLFSPEYLVEIEAIAVLDG